MRRPAAQSERQSSHSPVREFSTWPASHAGVQSASQRPCGRGVPHSPHRVFACAVQLAINRLPSQPPQRTHAASRSWLPARKNSPAAHEVFVHGLHGWLASPQNWK